MPYQTSLKVGDIISIKPSKATFLVVRSQHVTSDAGDGVPYRVDEIDVVQIDPNQWHAMFSPGVKGSGIRFVDSKVKSFYFRGGSMHGKGKQIDESDVKVLGTSKLKTEVEVTYVVSKAKHF